jgi:hypothetical protein
MKRLMISRASHNVAEDYRTCITKSWPDKIQGPNNEAERFQGPRDQLVSPSSFSFLQAEPGADEMKHTLEGERTHQAFLFLNASRPHPDFAVRDRVLPALIQIM